MLLEIILYIQTELVLVFLAITFLVITYVMWEFSFKKKDNSRKQQYQIYLELSNSCVKEEIPIKMSRTSERAA
jgi:ABC-type multidrug transport system permease subunit